LNFEGFMANRMFLLALALGSPFALAQAATTASTTLRMDAPTTLPIVFTRSVAAKGAHVGDRVTAQTTQPVHLADGAVIPSGAKVSGHVVAADPFAYDKTPYAKQKPSQLSISFDSIEFGGQALPLSVTVRAMAGPVDSQRARMPLSYDLDPSQTMTQIGGDQMARGQSEIVNRDGDVVEYNKHDGVYAHLIANGPCDGSDSEVSVGIYSASACGLYGFYQTSAEEVGSVAHPSTLTLVSTRVSPKIWKNTTALLEVLPQQATVSSR
jgi:hypothetical protein